MAVEYRKLGARLTPEAYQGIMALSGNLGVSVSALLEAWGRELSAVLVGLEDADEPAAWAAATGTDSTMLARLVEAGRAIDAERRRRA